eukprot:jgi/Ulvmu1/3399/UM016_0015.1
MTTAVLIHAWFVYFMTGCAELFLCRAAGTELIVMLCRARREHLQHHKQHNRDMHAGQEGQIRLVQTSSDGSGSFSGILEIFHAGAWGTLCDRDSNDYGSDYRPPFTEVRVS